MVGLFIAAYIVSIIGTVFSGLSVTIEEETLVKWFSSWAALTSIGVMWGLS